jgi:hypothetical protein
MVSEALIAVGVNALGYVAVYRLAYDNGRADRHARERCDQHGRPIPPPKPAARLREAK